MPAAWSRRDERQYGHILASCKRSRKTCKRIAAATVNKRRRFEGRTLSGIPALSQAQSKRRIAALRKRGCKITTQETPYGTVVYKKCP